VKGRSLAEAESPGSILTVGGVCRERVTERGNPGGEKGRKRPYEEKK
jgi:hypothetical protein